ncbi:hypothetical protein [Nonomuraea longicatena]|uniref:Integral membrane protein n=1 Tax=Nonomuraea longicatena TaxID=83682 RepID=A0ABN1PU35_9ACTN
MSTVTAVANKTKFLRVVLTLDAVVTGGNGLIYLIAAPLVSDLLGPDTGLLRGIGVFLVLYGLAVGALAARREISVGGTKTFIAMNSAWTIGSVAAVIFGLLAFTTIGAIWAVMQAAVVGAFAALQVTGLRKAAS